MHWFIFNTYYPTIHRMKGFWLILFSFIITLFSCTSAKIPNYHFNQKTAAPQLKEDVVLLQKILEANHPSLYWYTPKDSIDAAFDNAINSITDSLTEVEFRNKVAVVISKIRCGHTSVRFSKDYTKQAEKHRYPQFPLYIKTWGDSMVVLGSLLPKDSIFKRGTIITSINGKSNKTLLDSMFQLISTDGYSNNYKSQVFSGNFPVWYKLVWGLDSVYTITYVDALGNEKTASIKNFSPVKDTTIHRKDSGIIAKMPVVKPPSKKAIKQAKLLAKRSMVIDSSTNTAFIKVATFSDGHLRNFFRRSFKTIQQQHIQNVVFDLRENTGGKLNLSTLLTKYVIDKPFKTGDTIAAIRRKLKYSKYIKESEETFWAGIFTTRKMSDGRFHNRKAEQHYFNPKTNHHFNGNIYAMQGGYSFSAATLFISSIKGQKNVTIFGEETGGGNYGNSAMHLPLIILPNSKLRVVLPTYRLVIDSTRKKDGRGIMPDQYIYPSSDAIKKGIDLKLNRIKKMIAQNQVQGSKTN